MQPAKDSFYVELRNRLVAVDPQRTIIIDGATRPAIVVAENEPPVASPPLCDAFYLHWGSAHPVQPSVGTMMAVDCTISYYTSGAEQNGWLIAGAIWRVWTTTCSPSALRRTPTSVITVRVRRWRRIHHLRTQPVLSAAKTTSPYVGREIAITLFFYPEVNQT